MFGIVGDCACAVHHAPVVDFDVGVAGRRRCDRVPVEPRSRRAVHELRRVHWLRMRATHPVRVQAAEHIAKIYPKRGIIFLDISSVAPIMYNEWVAKTLHVLVFIENYLNACVACTHPVLEDKWFLQ